jgi:hypothetical protein
LFVCFFLSFLSQSSFYFSSFVFSTTMLTLLVASLVLFSTGTTIAAPPPTFASAKQLQKIKCSTVGAKLPTVAGSTVITQPDGDPSHIFAGIGVQNYTCADTGKYA